MTKVDLAEVENQLRSLLDEASHDHVEVRLPDGSRFLITRVLPPSEPQPAQEQRIGDAFDDLIGTWTAEQEREFLEAVEVFEQVDESFWS